MTPNSGKIRDEEKICDNGSHQNLSDGSDQMYGGLDADTVGRMFASPGPIELGRGRKWLWKELNSLSTAKMLEMSPHRKASTMEMWDGVEIRL